ncbi:helix-turn-helix domain-containing protein [Actinosynnema sp. NPDC020468]|uniref:TetR/AcrR family transcriptional regulator n=1 Tax=Actinosynnema sp. NPDC020468 TaxID=3154488 RepID=UPI0033E2C6E1
MTDRPRADARRNHDLIVSVAAEAFAEHGTDASLREIARRAGLGIGTLYRHFPTRDALLEALLRQNFDRLRGLAETSTGAPREALVRWLGEVARGSTTYRGLSEQVMAALVDESSELHASCVAMRAAGAVLLDRAQRDGSVAADVTAVEVLSLAAGVAWVSERSPIEVDRLLSLALRGI